MKYKLGDRVKEKKTKPDSHDDYEILSTFTSDKYNGYIVTNLYTNRVTGIECTDFDKDTKLSSSGKNNDGCWFEFLKDRYLRVKKQVVSHPDVINPKFNEW